MRNFSAFLFIVAAAAITVTTMAGCKISHSHHSITFTSEFTIGVGGSEATLPVHSSLKWRAEVDSPKHARTCTAEDC